MKLAFVELAGFRGFKDQTRFAFPGGFVVLTGRNGVGKSTVLDAVDFALTGTLNKYAVREAKGGGLDEHLWWVGEGTPAAEYVRIGFVDEGGDEFVITRSRERGLDVPSADIAHRLCMAGSPSNAFPETLLSTTLIRDETIAALSLDLPGQARFKAVRDAIGGLGGPNYANRTAALVVAANKSKTEQEKRIEELKAELGRTLSALTEARSAAERQPDVAEAGRILAALEPAVSADSSDRAEVVRRRVVERKQVLAILGEAVSRLERIHDERVYLASKAGEAEIALARSEFEKARGAREKCERDLVEAQRLEAAERQGDELAAHVVSLLQHGEAVGLQEHHCPLCQAVRTNEEFQAALSATRKKLSERGARIAAAMDRLQKAQVAFAQAERNRAVAEARLATLELRQKGVKQVIEEAAVLFAQHGFSAFPDSAQSARQLVLPKQEQIAQLERALYILEASGAHDRVTTLQGRLEQLRRQLEEESIKLAAAERAVEGSRQIDGAVDTVSNQLSMEQFDTVLPLLKELYQRLRPHADWREIETDFGGRVRASLNFVVGDGRNPQFIFSSGQRRAAGIAFLLAIHLSRPWSRLRSLLLDDPVQHIDDYRALNLVEVLSAIRRTGRQVIVAVEDPALADVLCRRLRSHAIDFGRRFEIGTSRNGSAMIADQHDVFPLPREVLKIAEAS